MMKRVYLLAAVLVLLCGMHAIAGGVGTTVKLGTLGLGVDVTVGLSDSANLRVGLNALSLDMDFDDDDDEMGGGATAEEIDLELNLRTFGALVDWFPFEGGFRLTGGLLLNNNEVDLTAPDRTVEINNNDYEVSNVSGTVGFNSIAPYIGIGGGNAVDEDGRWSFAWDLGVMFQGAPDVSLSATAADPSKQAQLDADIQQEINDIDEDTDVISVYPVASIGVGYRF